MTDTQLTVIQPTALVTINDKARELVTRLRFMIQNGRKLADQEVFALAQYCAANELNPFDGEAYYIPNIGPCPGIAGWRKKAQEALNFEAQSQHNTDVNFYWTEPRLASPSEAKFDTAKGDIAMVVVLRDSLTNKAWRRQFFDTMREMKDLGLPYSHNDVVAYTGPEPIWTGVAVVYGDENFGKDKFDRHERAQKRAEKLAIGKRFRRINLPEPYGADVEYVDAQFEERPNTPAHEAKSEAENMKALGFDEDAPKRPEPVTMTGKAAELTADGIAGAQARVEGQPEHVVYTGSLVGYGKGLKFPAPWPPVVAKYVKDNGLNSFEVAQIMWNLNISQDTIPAQVIDMVQNHLDTKAAGA